RGDDDGHVMSGPLALHGVRGAIQGTDGGASGGRDGVHRAARRRSRGGGRLGREGGQVCASTGWPAGDSARLELYRRGDGTARYLNRLHGATHHGRVSTRR